MHGASSELHFLEAVEGDALHHELTLPGVLISLVVNEVGHTATVVQPLLVVECLECLAGAVGFLGRYSAVVCIQGGCVVLGVFGAATPSQGAVPTILQIHAEMEGAGREEGMWDEEMEAEEEEEEEVVGRGDGGGLLAGLRNVSLHFNHLENRDRKRGDGESGETEKGLV